MFKAYSVHCVFFGVSSDITLVTRNLMELLLIWPWVVGMHQKLDRLRKSWSCELLMMGDLFSVGPACNCLWSGGRTRGELLPVIFFAFSSKDESGVSKDQLIIHEPHFSFSIAFRAASHFDFLSGGSPPLSFFFGIFGLGSVFTQLLPKESVSSFN